MNGQAPGHERRRLRCRLGWIPNAEYAGFWVAEAAGLYSERGLGVDFAPGGPGRSGAIESLIEGDAEVAITSDLPSLLEARAGGVDLRLLGAVMPRSPLGLAVLASSGIESLGDLAGRVIGAGTVGDRPLLDALFRANQLEPDYALATVDSGFAALAAGEVDALSCSTINQVPAAREAGHAVRAWTFAELGLAMPGDMIVCEANWALAATQDAARFLAASAEGWRRQLADHEVGARLTWERFGSSWALDLEACRRECAAQAGLMRTAADPLAIDEGELVATARLLAEVMGIDGEKASGLLIDGGPDLATAQQVPTARNGT